MMSKFPHNGFYISVASGHEKGLTNSTKVEQIACQTFFQPSQQPEAEF
jgi:hypothetical protein